MNDTTMETSTMGMAPTARDDPALAEASNEHEDLGEKMLLRQSGLLPAGWAAVDRAVVTLTRHALFVIGGSFTLVIIAEVLLRYAFSHSMFFANPLSKLLLVWFFLLGAGLALRQGAHMGFDLIAARLPPRQRRRLALAAHTVGALFFLEMLWAAAHAIGPALRQTDPALDISLAWLVSAVPIGFVLMLYHLLVIMVIEWRQRPDPGGRP